MPGSVASGTLYLAQHAALKYVYSELYVFLTVHLGIILVNNPLDAQLFFFFVYVYSKSLHVSSTQVLIIRRINCINTISGICHSV